VIPIGATPGKVASWSPGRGRRRCKGGIAISLLGVDKAQVSPQEIPKFGGRLDTDGSICVHEGEPLLTAALASLTSLGRGRFLNCRRTTVRWLFSSGPQRRFPQEDRRIVSARQSARLPSESSSKLGNRADAVSPSLPASRTVSGRFGPVRGVERPLPDTTGRPHIRAMDLRTGATRGGHRSIVRSYRVLEPERCECAHPSCVFAGLAMKILFGPHLPPSHEPN
jgi:hypothetical protein